MNNSFPPPLHPWFSLTGACVSSSITHVISSPSTAIPSHVLITDPWGLTCKWREGMEWEGGREGERNCEKAGWKLKKDKVGVKEWLQRANISSIICRIMDKAGRKINKTCLSQKASRKPCSGIWYKTDTARWTTPQPGRQSHLNWPPCQLYIQLWKAVRTSL